jgi:hypothetical protein
LSEIFGPKRNCDFVYFGRTEDTQQANPYSHENKNVSIAAATVEPVASVLRYDPSSLDLDTQHTIAWQRGVKVTCGVYVGNLQASNLQLVGGVELASASDAGIDATLCANFLGRCEIYRLRHKSNHSNLTRKVSRQFHCGAQSGAANLRQSGQLLIGSRT